MHNVRPLTRAIRILMAARGVLAFVGGNTVTFASEPARRSAHYR